MPTTNLSAGETMVAFHFPYAGIDVSQGFSRQPVRPIGSEQKYSRTCARAINVRAFDGAQNKLRGGSRVGLGRYINERVSGDALVQGIDFIVGVGYDPPGGNVQTSQSARRVTLVAVSNGNVKIASPGDISWTTPTNGLAALNTSGVVFSATNAGNLYFADGAHYKFYRPADNTVHPWVATAGAPLPVDSEGNAPRLIQTWRGRTVVSGLKKDPQNWFMSAVDEPGNFDYGPEAITPTQAVAGNNSTLGLVGDVINCLISFTDDVLIFGGDHTIWIMQGDPMDGGRLNLVTNSIGMAWGAPWCQGPQGEIYFFSNQCGIYTMTPGQPLVRISQPIDNLLKTVNTGSNSIRMVWDDRFQGFHVFVTKLSGPYRAVHAFYEARTGAWWLDVFANEDHNPLCCCTFDGNTSDDRVALVGSWDGYVRFLNADAADDDGTLIASEVVIGPFLTRDMDDILAKDIQALMGATSGAVDYAIHTGISAETALASEPVVTGRWEADRNLTDLIRRSGYAVYIRLSSTNQWAMEEIRLRLVSQGKVRRRGA